MKYTEEKKTDIFEEIQNVMLKEIEQEEKINVAELKKSIAGQRNGVLMLLERMLGKLLFKLHIKIIVSWGETELFTYEIPKN